MAEDYTNPEAPEDEITSQNEVNTESPVVAKKETLPQGFRSTPRARFALGAMASNVASVKESTANLNQSKNLVGKKGDKNQQQTTTKKRVDPLKDKYRDRAEERRKTTVEEAPEENLEDSTSIDAELLKERRERSKYLGGSEDTTHLVEGVDILLFERRKIEIEQEQARAAAMLLEDTNKNVLVGAKQLVITQDGKAQAVEAPQDFKTEIGRGIYDVLFRRERPRPRDTFLPGKTTYVFDLDLASNQELPTIVERTMLTDESETNRDLRYESILASTNPDAFKKLSNVMSYIKLGEKGLKKRKEDIEAQQKRAKEIVKETLQKFVAKPAVSSKPVVVNTEEDDDDDDMFADVPEKPSSSEEASKPKTTDELWKEVRESDGRPTGDTSAKRTREDMTPLAPNSFGAMEVDQYDGLDDYGSDDDEEDILAKDTGVRLKRADFATDAEWERYESSREAIPKAAFSFGIKAADGRKKEKRGKAEKVKLYHTMYKKVAGSLGANKPAQ